MKASETKLQQIIEGTKQYVVPLFQRSYSWDKKEWQVLLDDLIELCEEDEPRSHFIGSIVTMPTTSVPEGVAKYLLIDGQQRLTTIFIILTLLRDVASKDGDDEFAEEVNHTLLVNPYKKDQDYYKLLPTHSDRTAFQELVKPVNNSLTPALSQIRSAYEFFEKKLRIGRVNSQKLKKVITNSLSVVSIVLDNDDDPHLVFESLNAKGRPLSQSDLIRNYFFMRIHINDQEGIYTQYWRAMQDDLGESLTECIRHYLMKEGQIVKQSDVYFNLKSYIAQGNALEHLKELTRYARYYKKLLAPEYETSPDIQRLMLRLNRIEVTTAYPFLLNCYADYDQKKLSEKEYVTILEILENFMIRRFVCNVPTMGLNKIFPPLYSQVKNSSANTFLEGLRKVLQTKGYPKDSEFESRLKDTKLYGGGDRGTKTKLILESLENSYGHKEQVPFKSLTIEHILPQTLGEYWQDHLGNDWEVAYDLLLHTLGNLTLTAYNSELSNYDFPTKKQLLAESHLELNKYFEKKGSWRREDIEERSNYLAQIALKIWPYFGDDKGEQGKQTNVTGTTPTALWILGQHFKVRSWRDVLENTLNTIADLEPEKFEQIIEQYPHIIGLDKSKFREVRQIKSGVFVEVNLAAQSIQSLCFQMLPVIELSSDDWKVEYVQSAATRNSIGQDSLPTL